MPSFRFKLAPVLRYRIVVEDGRRRELGAAIQEKIGLQRQLQEMQQTITDSRRQLGDGLMGRVDLERIGHFARYSAQARARAQAIVLRLAGAEKQIQACREKLIEAVKARKALELLRDRHYKLWKQHQDRIETAALDEFAGQAFSRSRDEDER